MPIRAAMCAGWICATSALCAGQVLYEAANTAPAPDPVGAEAGESVASAAAPSPQGPSVAQRPPRLSDVGLIVVAPPEPRTFQANDLITIIISERSKTEREHVFDSKKTYEFGGEVPQWIDMLELLEARLQQGEREPLAEWALMFENRFKGDATYERDDSVTARVTARVVEVKPNGTMLLEARTVVRTDKDETAIVLSGVCRTEDVTITNTIQSNQMFDLNLDIQNAGDTRSGAAKGLIPKVLETLFNF